MTDKIAELSRQMDPPTFVREARLLLEGSRSGTVEDRLTAVSAVLDAVLERYLAEQSWL